VSPAFGRVTLTGTGLASPPVSYLAAPGSATESINAFATGIDSTNTAAVSGLLEPGATGNVALPALTGNYFFGDECRAVDGSAVSRAGVMSIATTGTLGGTEFDSAGPPAFLSQPAVTGTVTIDNAHGPGTGNVDANSVAITNGSELFYILEGSGAPASITVAEHQ
jgi:hypothetical protein